jgi:hypothetical protein
MKESQMNALNELRDGGYAVVVFSPEELEGAPPVKLQDQLAEYGWDVIEDLKEVTYE